MLSPILSTLYLSLFLYILEKHLTNLSIPISIISLIDDGLFIPQNKSFHISNNHLFCSYNIMMKLLKKFGLIVEHFKTKVFHFNRSHGNFNPPPLDLTPIGWSFSKVETIFTGYNKTIWNLDRSRKPQVLQEILQVK